MNELLERIKTRPLLFDGAFGTYYAVRRCDRFGKYEEANLRSPGTVRQIAFEYISAGCDAIKTNTFGANRVSLDCDGEHLRQVILAGCRLALEAAEGHGVTVFADIGPIPQRGEESLSAQYRELVDLFLEGGLRHFLFETMSSDQYLSETAAYIRQKAPDALVIVTFAVGPDGFTAGARSGQELLLGLQEDPSIDILGLNCVSGPFHMLRYLRTLPPLRKPLCVSPNAGYPTVEDGAARFGSNPRYFARQMLEIVSAGAAVIGGCCGTTPEHIHELALALHGQEAGELPRVLPKKEKSAPASPPPQAPESPFWQKLRQGQTVFAAELDPPPVSDPEKFLRHAGILKNGGVDILTLADCPVARVHADSCMMAARLRRELDLEPLPHMTCRDRNINATKALLLGLSMENIRNVLTVTGDPIPNAERSEVKGVWSFNSSILAGYIRQLSESGAAAPFHVWAALNVNAPNFAFELEKAKRKLEAGVCGFLTQPVFTSRSVEHLRQARAALPGCYLLGGIIPVTSYKSALYMNSEVAGIQIPEDVLALYETASREEALRLAVELSCQLGREIRPYVDGYYLITPQGRPSVVCSIIRNLREWEAQAPDSQANL